MFVNLHVRIYVGFILVGELHFAKERKEIRSDMGFVFGPELSLT